MKEFSAGIAPPPDLLALHGELAAAREELALAQRQQAATAEVLRIVSRSGADAAPVFEAILEACIRLFDPYGAAIYLVDGEMVKGVARRGFTDGDWGTDATPLAGSHSGQAIAERRAIHIEDLADLPRLPEHKRAAVRAVGGLTTLYVPMLSRDQGFGSLVVARRPKKPFSEAEIASLATFADQALIAIENARLVRETQESLAQQTATAEVLKTISRSAFDLDAVLHMLIDTAVRLARGSRGTIFMRDGDVLRARAFHSQVPTALKDYLIANPIPLVDSEPIAHAVQTGQLVHVPDMSVYDTERVRETKARAGFGAALWVPLMRNGQAIGVFGVPRVDTIPFSDREIELVRSFADQAVIAIENARLFEEVKARTFELQESLEVQTALSEVLSVISRSPSDLMPVLDSIASTAARICLARDGHIYMLRDGTYWLTSSTTPPGDPWQAYVSAIPITPNMPGSATARAARLLATVHVPDTSQDPEHDQGVFMKQEPRTVVSVPLVRDGQAVGVITLNRGTVDPFTLRQLDLLTAFADQAIIAIENARLFDEVQSKTRALTETLEQQTATSKVLTVISQSPSDLKPVLDAISETAAQLCGSEQTMFFRYDGEVFRILASWNFPPDVQAMLEQRPPAPGHPSAIGRAGATLKPVCIPDVLADPGYGLAREQARAKYRATLAVPMLREGRLLGALSLNRSEPGSFTDKQIALVSTFADQAVIAVENARLFDEVNARTAELAASLEELRTAQDRLIQTEKLASLGQLTAGIAHEIKNPLNFVNNFASLSAELVDELEELLAPVALDESLRAQVQEISGFLKSNLQKVASHGRRADSIVRNMLLHSRRGAGERRPVDVNTLVEESLNLAYHGARSEQPGFNVTFRREYDPAAGEADLLPQEITRVLLNLIGNGLYAVRQQAERGEPGYEPSLTVATRSSAGVIEIRVRDNGTGIPQHVKQKMFDPFYTTKPAGEGTGLGLSLSYDIVVKQHGGQIDVATEPGLFTEFTIRLPRRSGIGPMERQP